MTSNGSSQSPRAPTLRASLRYSWRFLGLIRPFWWPLLKGLLIGAGLSVAGLIIPYLTKLFVDEIYPAQNVLLMHVVVASVAGITLAVALATAIRTYYGTVVSTHVSAAVSLLFANHMQHKTARFYDQHRIGEIMGRFGELQRAVTMATGSLQQMILNGLYIVLIPPILLMLHWQLSLVALAGFPLVLVVWLCTGGALKRRWRRSAEAFADLNGLQVELLTHVRTLRSLAAERWSYQRMRHLQESAINGQLRASGLGSAVTATTSTLETIVAALFTWYAWTLILSQQLSLGTFVAFTAYLALFTRPTGQFSGMLSSMQQTVVSLERVFEYFDAPVEQDPAQAASTEVDNGGGRLHGDIVLTDVSFGYTADRRVLNGISCRFKPGTVTAIIGPSGAGKSSLLRLISRLDDVDDGIITIDDRDIQRYGLRELRNQVSVVPQGFAILRGTVWDNLVLGREGVSDAAVWRALDISQVSDFVRGLPMGLLTSLAEFGASMSAGQQQRLAIARAVLRATPILLLDEATANLDLDTEAALLNALLSAERSCTIVMATHRVHTAARADQILVLDNGRVAACGPHNVVVGSWAPYARQFSTGTAAGKAAPGLRMIREEG